MGRRKGSVNKVDINDLPKGVSFIKDGRAKPWKVKHRDLKYETYATPEEAVARKQELIDLEKDHGHAALTYSRAVHADVTEARKILPDEVSHTEAAKFWVEHHPSIILGTADAVDQFITLRRSQSIRPDGWTRHTKDLKSRLGRFKLSFGEKPLPEITGESILSWLGQLKDEKTHEPLAARTIANYRSELENFFNYAARRKWVAASPMDAVIQDDLPTVRRSKKHPLSVNQANLLLETIETETPRYVMHFALRLFIGIRTEESQRFQWDWIQRDQNRIVIPGWFFREDDEVEQGTKTGDDWVIDDIAPRFWAIYDAEDRPTHGNVPKPSNNRWHGYTPKDKKRKAIPSLKKAVLAKLELKRWPHNATRDTFCTLHMSAYRNGQRTALVLKHRNAQTLWQSYLGSLIPQDEAIPFFEDTPQLEDAA